MILNTEIKNSNTAEGAANAVVSANKPREAAFQKSNRHKRNQFRGRKTKSRRPASDFAQKVIDVRRVARVVAGGRRFSFSVVLVLGDRKGSVGVGIGKAADTARAIEKAIRTAKKNMVKVHATPSMSIPHEVDSKFGSARIVLIPARGRGLVAGSSVRTVLDLAGLTDISAKVLSRSKNKLNNARATIKALKELTHNFEASPKKL
ncbi:MAG: 30S ribosomal protein S5 [Parcubacteria group bacterium]|nr:30S ribosomal protein S5 [Parcubacteria group bacterium]